MKSLVREAASGLPGTNRNVRLLLKGVLASMIFLLPGRFSMAQGFSSRADFSLGASSWGIAIGDLDGDGKKDVGASTWNHGTIALLRNQSTPGVLSFAGVTNVSTNIFTPHVDFGDIDGDGKLDIVNTSLPGATFSVHQNTSSVGSLSFVNVLDTSCTGPIDLELCDVDGDGKLDVIVISKSDYLVNVYRNTSTPGSFSLAAPVSKSTDANPECVTVGDIDGDGKKDIIVSCYSANSINVFRNTSSSGSVSLESAVSYATDVNPAGVKTADIDGDSKLDIVVSNHAGTFSTFRNTASSGVINSSSLASRVDIALSGPGYDGLAIRDFNGDGKADVFVGLYGSSYIVSFINTSTAGSVSYTASTPLAVAANALDIIIEDMDGDGYMDIVSGDLGYTSLGIFKGVAPVAATISSSTNVTCIGGSNGSATVSATGGSGSYTYSWAPSGGTSATASGLSAGTYTCTVTGGGTATVSVTITQPSTPLPRILAPANRIVTMAGNGTGTFSGDGGDARYASLKFVVNVCMDKAGNVYIADNNNRRIRKVNTSGIISTIAGNGTSGNTGDGGPATAAEISVSGVATDAAGNVYFTDQSNNVVRKIGTDGVITRFAGTGGVGFNGDGIQATAATLTNPSALAIDAAGNVYIGSSGSGRIRKVAASGVITTFAGNGTGSGAGDGSAATTVSVAPMNMNFDPSGNLYYVEQGTGRARRISTSGIVNTVAGTGTNGFSGDGGAATAAQLNSPSGIAVDAFGNIFIADAANSRIRKVDASGIITTIAGNGTFVDGGDNGPASAGTFAGMLGLWIDNEQNLLIAQNGGSKVRKIFMNDTTAKLCAGGSGTLRSTSTGGTWSSSSTSVATVGSTGLLSAVAGGTSVLTYTLPSGCYGTAGVVVDAPSGAFTVTPSSACIGTSQAFVSNQASCAGNALSFTASTHKASKSGVISTATQNFTMEAWVKFNGATAAYQVIMHNGNTGGDGYGLVLQPSSTTLVLLRGGLANTATGFTLPTTGWHHVALVNNAGNWSAYLDGVRSAFSDGSVATPTTGFCVGNSTGGSQRFNGIIDEVTYWNVARTNAQIIADMNACNIATNANLLGYWKFDEASGSTTADASGNGNTLTVTGASRVASSAYISSYSWSFGDGATSTLAATSRTYSAAATYTPTLSVTDVLGCSGTTTSSVTVNALPSVSAGSGVAICTGTSTTLTATGGTTYSWAPATGLSATTGASVTASPSSTTTYTVTGTNTNGCSNTATVTVSVNSTPSASTGQAFTCDGGSITLSNVTGGGTWSSSNTAIATVGSSTGVVTGVDSGTVNITYTLGTGCYTVKSIDVNPPMASITGSPYVCLNTISDLDHVMAGGTWSVASPYYVTVDASTGVITGEHSGATTVTYTVNSGCVVTTPVYTSNVILNITGSLSVCEGSTSMLTVPGYAGATWSTPDSATAFINATTGALLGISAGTVPVTVTYGYCYRTAVASVNPVPATISGGSAVCAGNTLSLSCSTGGGVWSSTNPARGTVDGSGVVTGLAPGTTAISYTIGTGCAATRVVTVGAMPAAITGTTTLCQGATTNLACTTLGGTWSSSATGTADVVSGTVTATTSHTTISGVATGGATISYSMPTGCVQTVNVTVAAPPSSIGGTMAICSGGSSTLTSSGGGTWSSSLTTVATIGSATGIVTGGATTGTATITYRTSTTCYTTAVVTVSTPSAISGPASVCKTYTVTMTHGTGGGTWSSSNPSIAAIDGTTGVVTGVLAGAVTITYTISTGCFAVRTIQVYNNPSAISGTSTMCAGASVSLTGTSGTGTTWSSSNTSVATVGSSTGLVTGVAAGSAEITYTATSTGCFTTRAVSVNEAPSVITGANTVCAGSSETYMSTPTGGSWSSSAPAVGSINSGTGIATGVAGGGTTIRYTLSSGCFVTKAITVSALPVAITGTTLLCVGNSVVLSSTTSGATWSTSASGTASITATTATTATVAGISSGMANISYTNAAGCSRVAVVTVNAAVAAIEGADVVCSGNTITLTNATGGGTWGTSSAARVGIVSATGVASGGTTVGSAVITYRTSTACFAIKYVTNNAAVANIAGTTSVCVDATTTFTNTTPGGTWSSSGTIAMVDATTGVITGMTGGTNTISYIVSEGCFKTKAITVKALPVISGASEVFIGGTTTLTGSPTPGTWTSDATGIATVGVTGVVTGVTAGDATISYYAGGCTGMWPITVRSSGSSRPADKAQTGNVLFSVFPNPTHGSLSVNTGIAGTFVIYTVDGKLASSTELIEGVNAINMPVGMAAGTYLCRFQGVDGSVQAVRLVYEP